MKDGESMKQTVVIKSFPNGIHVNLDPNVEFEELYVAYAEKFRDSAKFFGDAKIVISFEGRELSALEERALIEAIGEYTDLTVLCIMDHDEAKNQLYIQAANAFSPNGETENGSVYKGTLHAGQNLETEGSIVVLGDVNPGASVKAAGSVVILGTVYGDVWAGYKGDESTFVSALEIKAESIKVSDLVCRNFVKSAGFLRKTVGPRIIYIYGDEIVCDEISKEFLANIPF